MNTLNNRTCVPAVCRIEKRGTAFLVATGVLLTTRTVVPNAREAAKLKAIFFEGSKKPVVSVQLLPERLFFVSLYPEHVDYCLVACDTAGIFNVVPIKVPLVRKEWSPIHEGDTLLVVQHLIPQKNTTLLSDEAPVCIGRFDDVLRKKDDLLYLKVNGTDLTAGCPAFNDESELVGVQSQLNLEIDGYVSRVLSIITIVNHLFANAMCSKLQHHPHIDDIWDTWYVPNDTTRIISIMANFKSKEVLNVAVKRLCEHTSQRDLREGVVACGGTKVIVASIQQFKEDEGLILMSLRSLWNISFDEVDNRQDIIDAEGVPAVLDSMENFPKNEEIVQFAVVLLYNLTLTESMIIESWCSRCLRNTLDAARRFMDSAVLQKFSAGLFVNILRKFPDFTKEVLQAGAVDHIVTVVKERIENVLLIENCVQFFATVAATEWNNPLMRQCVLPTIDLMLHHRSNSIILLCGNNALWSLGLDIDNRVELLRHPQGATVLCASIDHVASQRKH
eukprot:Tbor_TRINITY_DN5635_c0_g5::TRINITY_DN5635_c0_g5_i2::g.9045::m.9045